MTVCFTSLTCAYLPRARVLASTLRRHHPDWALWAVLVDEPPPDLDVRRAFAGFDRVIDARVLVPDFRRWVFGHDPVSACCAVKGAALVRLLGMGAERVVYLDPDIALFAPLPPAEAPIELTPHRLSPDDDTPAGIAAARDAFRHGIHNLGFLSVTGAAQGRAFAAWWAARLAEACVDEPSRGLFVDQRYCDVVPALFPAAGTLRDPGCNVATWNLDQRPLAFDGASRLTASGEPLRFMHFSKHGGAGDRAIECHAAASPIASELWAWYGRALAAETRRKTSGCEWRWARDAAGLPIPPTLRAAWRERPDARAAFGDPFAIGPGSFAAWWADHLGQA